MASPSRSEKLNSLQFGRGLAALAVVIFHLNNWIIGERGRDITGGLSHFGSRGVEFFFVLSGFIIVYIHTRDIGHPERWASFARKRFNRVYPIYWLYTAIVVGLLLAKHPELLPADLATWASAVTLVRFSDTGMPIVPAWTLFHEVAFYGLFSILIFHRSAGIVALGLWLIASCASFALLALPESRAGTGLSVLASPYNLCFFLGIGAWYLAERLAYAATAVLLTLMGLGIAMLVATAVWLPGISPAYGAGFALLIAGAVAFERRRELRAPFLSLLGDASYSLYLTHITVISAAANAAEAFHISALVPLFLFLLCSAVIGGIALYLCLERPLMQKLAGRPVTFIDPLLHDKVVSALRSATCLLGKHERLRSQVRDEDGCLESACRHCGTSM